MNGNKFSAIRKAAFLPLASPSKQIIGLEKNFQIKFICASVKAIPELATTYFLLEILFLN